MAEAITRRKREIVDRWLDLVQERLENRTVDVADLEDGLEHYLDGIAEALRTREDPGQTDGGALWEEVAREHAVTRVKLGFDITQLIEEFFILRRVIFDIAREERLLSGRRVEAVAELIGEAVRSAVRSYTDARDYATRRAEAEHVAFITHELRNPLTTALVAASDLTGPEDEKRRRELLLRSLRKIEDLIEGVLVTERFQAGEVDPEPVDVALGAVLDDTLVAAETKARAKGLGWVANFDRDLRLRVDPQLTSSAVHNLLENAVKFTDSGRVEVKEEHRDDCVVIHVRDTGPGVPEEDLPSIFEPFQRGHSSKKGSGIGLSIARRAIEIQGGTLQVESKAGSGTHFWITLGVPVKGDVDGKDPHS
jgi:signal transduction histidine kinase